MHIITEKKAVSSEKQIYKYICTQSTDIYAHVFTPMDKSLQNEKMILKIKYSKATTVSSCICVVSSGIAQGCRQYFPSLPP
jgi:hypothetical protein